MPSLNVSLDGSNRLSVGDSGGLNSIPASSSPTTITWSLTGKLQVADFVPMSAAEPGFAFAYAPGTLQGPPLTLFGTAQVGNSGNSMSIVDNHLSAATNGQWIYILRVIYNGTVYATTVDGPGGTTRNPIIINR